MFGLISSCSSYHIRYEKANRYPITPIREKARCPYNKSCKKGAWEVTETISFPKLNQARWDSKIHSPDVQRKERWLGFFFGPAGIVLMNGIISTFLNLFYTDVMRVGNVWHGLFLLVFPIVSKALDAGVNLLMGTLVERTRSKQGKARPWVLLSMPMLVVSSLLLFLVPRASEQEQIIWIVVSYNLYYGVAYTCYSIGHTMLVPLSTRNVRQRDGLAMLSNMATGMIPGFVVAMLFPLLIRPLIGVDQSKWITMAAIFSAIMVPCVFVEYFYTKERISEETAPSAQCAAGRSIREQAAACVKSKYWLIIMAVMVINQICAGFQNQSLVYYCDWVLGSYNDGVTQTLVSAVGNAPLGIGIFVMLPLVRKFGKRNVMLAGLAVELVGSAIFLINPTSMPVVLAGLMIRAFGALPLTYTLMAMMADTMDHVEWRAGFRCDGFTTSLYSIIFTVGAGISQGLFNLGNSLNGYVPPTADGSLTAQSEAVRQFFVTSYVGIYAVGCAVMLLLFCFYRLDRELPSIHEDIQERNQSQVADEA